MAGYKTWGTDIDANSHEQMRVACELPVAVAGALMPDAHLGYGLPIGGVLATRNAVIPYAVGVDIACRMRLSVFPIPGSVLSTDRQRFIDGLKACTRFGIGSEWEKPHDHPVLDEDWSVTEVTAVNKDKARRQLGTSGSGNHFAEFGTYNDIEGLQSFEGQVALLTHSGSRGTGAAVCDTYSKLAKALHPELPPEAGHLGWLDMDSQPGQEYWAAMQLMGKYAAANHYVIHKLVEAYLGTQATLVVENHHNFAWEEVHNGELVIVHRKGATPAGYGELGVIPGTMADPAYIVEGLGNPDSLCSSSHGAGRVMSRKQANKTFDFQSIRADLKIKGITVMGSGADEVPGVYKNIHEVMRQQQDLVKPLAYFQPQIVQMSGDGKAED